MKTKEVILSEFEKFINNDFDLEFGGIKKEKQETNRWIFCWDGEQDKDLPFDCACCIDGSIGNSNNCGCRCHKRIKQLQDFISQSLDDYADWKIRELTYFLEHSRECILSQFEEGEPTKDGGYRQKYAGKWYQTRPINEIPKCTCGLDQILSNKDKK